jgi:hypothetical protein
MIFFFSFFFFFNKNLSFHRLNKPVFLRISAAELPELLASVRTVISDCTGHDIGVAGSVAVARGFRETRRRFAHKASVKKISEIEKKAHPLTECSRNAVDLPVAIRFVKAVMKEIQLDG